MCLLLQFAQNSTHGNNFPQLSQAGLYVSWYPPATVRHALASRFD